MAGASTITLLPIGAYEPRRLADALTSRKVVASSFLVPEPGETARIP